MIFLDEIPKDKIQRDMLEFDSLMNGAEFKKFIDFMDQTNKFSGIILKKAELDKNFNKVYTQAVEKITELQFIDLDESDSDESFIEILGKFGG